MTSTNVEKKNVKKFVPNWTDVDEVPVTRQFGQSSQALPFGWQDALDACKAAKKGQKALFIPASFWTDERDMKPEDVTAPAIKERIRRSFYGWRDGSLEGKDLQARRDEFSISIGDKVEKGEYKGATVYFMVTSLKPKKAAA